MTSNVFGGTLNLTVSTKVISTNVISLKSHVLISKMHYLCHYHKQTSTYLSLRVKK